MIVVHHLADSRSQRILWLLEELGLSYEVKRYERNPQTRFAPPELKAAHPLGKSPVIVYDGRTIIESGAIIDYLIRRHGSGRLQPDLATAAYDDYVQWLHYAEGSAMLPLLLHVYAGRLGDAAAPLRPRIDGEIANHLGYIDAALRDREYFVGDTLSGADIAMSFVGEFADSFGRLADRPAIRSWLTRLHARAAYQTALQRGGPYSFAR